MIHCLIIVHIYYNYSFRRFTDTRFMLMLTCAL